jgi:hypothetical protein
MKIALYNYQNSIRYIIKIMNAKKEAFPYKFDIKEFTSFFHVNFANILGKGHDANVF